MATSEVVLVGLKQGVFLFIGCLACRRDSLRLRYLDNNDLALLALLGETSLDITLQPLVVYYKDYAAAEAIDCIHQRLRLLLVFGSEPIDDCARGEDFWEHWPDHVCHLLHLIVLLTTFLFFTSHLFIGTHGLSVELVVVHELAKVVLLLNSDCLGEFAHLLVEEGVGDVLHVTMEVRDRVLCQSVTRQDSALVAEGGGHGARWADLCTREIQVDKTRLPALLDGVIDENFTQCALATLLRACDEDIWACLARIQCNAALAIERTLQI